MASGGECATESGVRLRDQLGYTLVRVGRGSIEKVAKSALSIVHYGKKQVVPPVTNELLLQPAYILAQKIRRKEVSSTEIVKAYLQRITEVNSLITAVVDRRTTQALEDAAKVDELVWSGSKTEQELEEETPLLGVPFTSKEACLVKGLSSTSGLICRKNMTADEDSEAVARLRAAGAIPIAVTNTSEICMWWETYNNLHGQTKNPYDTTRTVGGSSGGEAAIIGAGGSLIGLGTDLGGSIRLPCFFTGIFGHKPSSGLVPHGGQFPPVKREVIPYVVTGPMARYAKDLRLLLKVLAGEKATVEHQLNMQVDLQSIKVYYMFDDGDQPTRAAIDPEIWAAMQKVVDWLSQSGAQTEEARIRNLKFGFLIWCACIAEIKDQRISDLMTGHVKDVKDSGTLGHEMWRWLSGKSEYTFPIILNAFAQDYVVPLMKMPLEYFVKRKNRLVEEMNKILGDKTSVFLFPTFPTPAEYHGHILSNPLNVGLSVVFNALGLPTTQCPLGLTQSGLPIGMQIVTAHGQDRLSLSVAEKIEEEFGGWINPS